MARSIHEQYQVQRPDFIPEGQEYRYPSQGGIFCDFIPAGSSCDEVRPIEPVAEVSTEDIPPHAVETLETLPVTDEQIEDFATELLDTFTPARPKKK